MTVELVEAKFRVRCDGCKKEEFVSKPETSPLILHAANVHFAQRGMPERTYSVQACSPECLQNGIADAHTAYTVQRLVVQPPGLVRPMKRG